MKKENKETCILGITTLGTGNNKTRALAFAIHLNPPKCIPFVPHSITFHQIHQPYCMEAMQILLCFAIVSGKCGARWAVNVRPAHCQRQDHQSQESNFCISTLTTRKPPSLGSRYKNRTLVFFPRATPQSFVPHAFGIAPHSSTLFLSWAVQAGRCSHTSQNAPAHGHYHPACPVHPRMSFAGGKSLGCTLLFMFAFTPPCLPRTSHTASRWLTHPETVPSGYCPHIPPTY